MLIAFKHHYCVAALLIAVQLHGGDIYPIFAQKLGHRRHMAGEITVMNDQRVMLSREVCLYPVYRAYPYPAASHAFGNDLKGGSVFAREFKKCGVGVSAVYAGVIKVKGKSLLTGFGK